MSRFKYKLKCLFVLAGLFGALLSSHATVSAATALNDYDIKIILKYPNEKANFRRLPEVLKIISERAKLEQFNSRYTEQVERIYELLFATDEYWSHLPLEGAREHLTPGQIEAFEENGLIQRLNPQELSEARRELAEAVKKIGDQSNKVKLMMEDDESLSSRVFQNKLPDRTSPETSHSIRVHGLWAELSGTHLSAAENLQRALVSGSIGEQELPNILSTLRSQPNIPSSLKDFLKTAISQNTLRPKWTSGAFEALTLKAWPELTAEAEALRASSHSHCSELGELGKHSENK